MTRVAGAVAVGGYRVRATHDRLCKGWAAACGREEPLPGTCSRAFGEAFDRAPLGLRLAARIHPIPAPLAERAAALAFGVSTVRLMLPIAGAILRDRGHTLVAPCAAFAFVAPGRPLEKS
jgi:hypothetical protein